MSPNMFEFPDMVGLRVKLGPREVQVVKLVQEALQRKGHPCEPKDAIEYLLLLGMKLEEMSFTLTGDLAPNYEQN